MACSSTSKIPMLVGVRPFQHELFKVKVAPAGPWPTKIVVLSPAAPRRKKRP